MAVIMGIFLPPSGGPFCSPTGFDSATLNVDKLLHPLPTLILNALGLITLTNMVVNEFWTVVNEVEPVNHGKMP